MVELAELESQVKEALEIVVAQKKEIAQLKSVQEEASQNFSQLSGRIEALEKWKGEMELADEDKLDVEVSGLGGEPTDEQRTAILKDFIADMTFEDWLKIGAHESKNFLTQLAESQQDEAGSEEEATEQPMKSQVRLSDVGGEGFIELPPDIAEKMPMGMKWLRIEEVPAPAAS